MMPLVKCGIKDGMVLSFHHHFREGDYVVNMVMEEVHKMGHQRTSRSVQAP